MKRCSASRTSSKATSVIALVVALVFTITQAAVARQPPLTNADVTRLARSGLSPETLVAAITTAPDVTFDTSPEGLVWLTQQQVPDIVIRAMIQRVKLPSADLTPSTAPSMQGSSHEWWAEYMNAAEVVWMTLTDIKEGSNPVKSCLSGKLTVTSHGMSFRCDNSPWDHHDYTFVAHWPNVQGWCKEFGYNRYVYLQVRDEHEDRTEKVVALNFSLNRDGADVLAKRLRMLQGLTELAKCPEPTPIPTK
jgi:hypothetical protein